MFKYIINIVTVLLSLFSIYSSLIYVLYLIANMLGISLLIFWYMFVMNTGTTGPLKSHSVVGWSGKAILYEWYKHVGSSMICDGRWLFILKGVLFLSQQDEFMDITPISLQI